jgi:phage-related protein
MATIASLAVELILDAAEYQSKLQKAAGETEGFADKLKGLGSKITGAGKAMTVGMTLPLAALGTAAIMAGSDLDESLNKVSVVFGNSAGDIEAWSSTAAKSFGLSQQQALEAAGTFGNLFTSMEIGQKESAGMSKGLVALAADLASFNNIDPTVALEKLRAGIVGEVEPLRALGVNLTMAATKAKAMEMGLADTTEALTQADLTQARYALILEQTANAQGDFARTSDGLANSTRIVKAQIADQAAILGTQLLPIGLKVVTFLRELLDRFSNLSPAMRTVIVVVGGIAAAIGPLLIVVGSLVGALGTILPVIGAVVGVLSGPVLLVIAAVVAAVALLAAAWKNNWGGIQEKTMAVIDFIKGVIQSGLAAVQAFWDRHGAAIMEAAETAWNFIRGIIDQYLGVIKSIFAAFKAAFEGDWRTFGEKLREAWNRYWELIAGIIRTIGPRILTLLATLITNIIAKFQNTDWKQVGLDIVRGIGNGIAAMASWLAQKAIDVARAAYEAAKGFLGIDSPSKKGIFLGASFVKGIVKGIEKAAPELKLTMLDVAEAVLDIGGKFAGHAAGFAQVYDREVLEPLRERVKEAEGIVKTFSLSPSQRSMASEAALRFEVSANNLLDDAKKKLIAKETLLLRIEEKRKKLNFLSEQLNLVKTLASAGLDAKKVLAGIPLGINASAKDLLKATEAAMDALINQADKSLAALGPQSAFPSGVSAGGNTEVVHQHYHLNVESGRSMEAVVQDFDMMRALANG